MMQAMASAQTTNSIDGHWVAVVRKCMTASAQFGAVIDNNEIAGQASVELSPNMVLSDDKHVFVNLLREKSPTLAIYSGGFKEGGSCRPGDILETLFKQK